MNRSIKNKRRSIEAPGNDYNQFFFRKRARCNREAYGESAIADDRNKIIANFRKAANEVEGDVLRYDSEKN